MKINCPYCSQPLELDDDFPEGRFPCPTCGQEIFVPVQTAPPPQSSSFSPTHSEEETDLDAANSFLERLIGNVLHAIGGIFIRIFEVARWIVRQLLSLVRWMLRNTWNLVRFLFSIRFLKFLTLLVVLGLCLSALSALLVAPYVLVLWIRRTAPLDVWPDWLRSPSDHAFNVAFPLEIVWLSVFAIWGIVKGVKSYRRGVIARWRTRRKERKAAKRAAKEAAKAQRI